MKFVGCYLRVGQTLFDKFVKERGQVYADQLDIRAVCKRVVPDFVVECGRAAIVDDVTAFAMLQIVCFKNSITLLEHFKSVDRTF